jgi:2-polyprenyl-6-hydroxyphenyl methylase/3-demethylubiquinone-9 3-methyltransferase
MPDEPFAFGKNWREFVEKHLTAERVAEAQESLRKFTRGYDFHGKTFLDIGCGSGLFSLCAHRLGAQVTSFDVDKDSVGCCEYLHNSSAAHRGESAGSVLDRNSLRR